MTKHAMNNKEKVQSIHNDYTTCTPTKEIRVTTNFSDLYFMNQGARAHNYGGAIANDFTSNVLDI